MATEQIISLYKDGNSIAKVSQTTGVSHTQVRRILKKNNIARRSNKTSADIEQEILRRYQAGENSEVLCKEFKLNASTICRIIKRLGGKIRPAEENKRKFKIRYNFFDIIDTEEKAYFLGFLMADGNVDKKRNNIRLVLHQKDVDILYKLRSALFIGDPLPSIGEDRVYRYLTISSAHIKEALGRQGCVPAKTFKTSLPQLPDDLMWHFLRGLYDGDGGITIDKARVRIHLTGFDGLLREVKYWIYERGIFGAFSNYKDKPHVSSLVVSARVDSYKFLDKLYGNSSIHLERKYNLYLKSKKFLQTYLDEPIKTPQKYSSNLFSYHSEKVSANWLLTKSIEERKDVADSAFKYFRKYGFPFPNFTADERAADFNFLKLSRCSLEDDEIKKINNAGLKIFKHYCRHYFDVQGHGLPSMKTAFEDDIALKKAIDNRMGITYKEVFNITGNMIRQGIRNARLGFAASVFKPSVAKFIYDMYAPANASVLDISAGFGQRMLGAAASSNVIHYTGLDPWKETINALTEMHYNEISDFSVKLINTGSEKHITKPNIYDICFSSPPFYNKEVYNNSENQAYNNKSFDEFLNNWWLPTAKMVHMGLKPGGIFVLNMSADLAPDMLNFVRAYFEEKSQIYISFTRKHMAKGAQDIFYVLSKK